ncbi:hypothetical protein [Lysobacter gummosus]|uniref:hypothetical protein n=1 Tax=Lysobacter gummosus TaxID=262324 RepID=UPI00362CE882
MKYSRRERALRGRRTARKAGAAPRTGRPGARVLRRAASVLNGAAAGRFKPG